MTLLPVAGSIAILLACAAPTSAADNMIRPTCWEENKGDHVERHCEVKRDAPGRVTASPVPQPSHNDRVDPRAAAAPPLPPAPIVVPRGYCGRPYAPGFCHPSYMPSGPIIVPPPVPPYVGPPIVFGIGPFSVWLW